jgi:dTDP-4-amino-4,6-dideoxygalactose transaminase
MGAVADSEIPVFDLRIEPEDIEAVADVLRSGWLTMGPRTQELEQRLAEELDCAHVVALSSCTAALHLACLAAGVEAGDEVIVPSMTFVATAAAVRYCGATPVFADIVGGEDLGIDVERIAELIGPRTKAVIPVHFAGYPVAIDSLRQLCRERDVALLEDAAHTPMVEVDGRSLGTFGDGGCFSFFSNKVLATGEGGALATESDEIAATVRSLRSHAMTSVTWDRHRGHAETYDVIDVGFNYRIDESRAALLLSRMRRLDAEMARRRELVARYRELLAEIPGLTVAYGDFDLERSSGYLMVVLLDDPGARRGLRMALRERHGVQTTIFPAVHRLTAYHEPDRIPALPRTETAADAHVVLPLYPQMTAEDQDRVCRALAAELAASTGTFPANEP